MQELTKIQFCSENLLINIKYLFIFIAYVYMLKNKTNSNGAITLQ
jgi:hypothetical protein